MQKHEIRRVDDVEMILLVARCDRSWHRRPLTARCELGNIERFVIWHAYFSTDSEINNSQVLNSEYCDFDLPRSMLSPED